MSFSLVFKITVRKIINMSILSTLYSNPYSHHREAEVSRPAGRTDVCRLSVGLRKFPTFITFFFSYNIKQINTSVNDDR